MKDLKDIINLVLTNNDLTAIDELNPQLRFREDLEMDSIVLAELTVRVEDAFNIDVFEEGMIYTIEDIIKKISI